MALFPFTYHWGRLSHIATHNCTWKLGHANIAVCPRKKEIKTDFSRYLVESATRVTGSSFTPICLLDGDMKTLEWLSHRMEGPGLWATTERKVTFWPEKCQPRIVYKSNKLLYLIFIYLFWLCWVLVAMRPSHCCDFFCWGARVLGHAGFCNCGT